MSRAATPGCGPPDQTYSTDAGNRLKEILRRETGTQPSGEQRAGDSQTWPYSSRYFNPESMSGQHALRLLEDHAEFCETGEVPAPITTIDMDGVGNQTSRLQSDIPVAMHTTLSAVDELSTMGLRECILFP